jgi:hypothetical protein
VGIEGAGNLRIKTVRDWRDAEADLIARLGGGIGQGSGFRVDFANAQTKLINQRTEVLKKYLSEAASP